MLMMMWSFQLGDIRALADFWKHFIVFLEEGDDQKEMCLILIQLRKEKKNSAWFESTQRYERPNQLIDGNLMLTELWLHCYGFHHLK